MSSKTRSKKMSQEQQTRWFIGLYLGRNNSNGKLGVGTHSGYARTSFEYQLDVMQHASTVVPKGSTIDIHTWDAVSEKQALLTGHAIQLLSKRLTVLPAEQQQSYETVGDLIAGVLSDQPLAAINQEVLADAFVFIREASMPNACP